MESDFVTRNHIDSLTNDPGTFELLNKYKFPPQDVPFQLPPQQAPSQNFGDYNNSNQAFFGNIFGQIQGYLQSNKKDNNFDGLQLNINADVLRWLILLIILVVLVWVIWQVQKKRRQNPLKKKLAKIEKQIRKLSMHRNPDIKQLTDSKLESYDELDGLEESEVLDDLDDLIED